MEKIFKSKKKNSSKGFAGIIAIIAVSSLVLILTFSLSASLYTKKQISKNLSNSLHSYYLAESGAEDAVLRVLKNYTYTPTSVFTLDGASITRDISESGDTITINVASSYSSDVRKLTTSLTITTAAVSFFYGVQVGAGGLEMSNNSTIIGNLYSDGSVVGGNGGSSKITGDAVVANGNGIDRVIVKGNLKAHTIARSNVCGDAYYFSAATIDAFSLNFLNAPSSPTCSLPLTNGIAHPNSVDMPAEPMPVTAGDIAGWKAAAEAGNIYSDAAHCSPPGDIILGPAKLDCDFTLVGHKKLTISGTIWVSGNVNISDGGIIELASGYGGNSGVILADNPGNETTSGVINTENNVVICGSNGYNSGSKTCNPANESYVLLLSTHSGATIAINVKNNADGAIFYASNGIADVSNNANVREVTAYKLKLEENTAVTYESGLASAAFTSGPGGGWQFDTWNETQ